MLVILAALFFWLINAESSFAAEASCLIEARADVTSCWGVVIQLDRGSFKPKIGSEQITVVEAKYGRNLLSLMNWAVSPDGKRLTVKFKQGKGDFGSGNTVIVRVAAAALSDIPPRDWFEWSVDTGP
jgi:hypothetical protein